MFAMWVLAHDALGFAPLAKISVPRRCPTLSSGRFPSRGPEVRCQQVDFFLAVFARGFPAPAEAGDPMRAQRKTMETYGARFLKDAKEYATRRQDVASERIANVPSGSGEAETVQPEDQTRVQIQNLLGELRGKISVLSAYMLHRRGVLRPKVEPALNAEDFSKLFVEERTSSQIKRRFDVVRRRRRKINYSRLNTGYAEEEEFYEAEEQEFKADWRTKSIVEDFWKAECNKHIYRKVHDMFPERQPLAMRTDRLADIAAAAFRRHFTDQNRPVLTHELSDYDNPYMLKRSALERLLQERCVRNRVDERCLPQLLDRRPDLVKLRMEAPLPPEVVEPLAAFRGDTHWHFDACERLVQKLMAADEALGHVAKRAGDVSAAEMDARPEILPGLRHPWKNHIGFESAVPRGVAGGQRFGQPAPALQAQLQRLRYPTLQRVAHTLPKDPKWRAHVAQTIRVLERSKHWDYQSKLRAVNTMKEIYDNMRPNDVYTAGLDKKLPLNRTPQQYNKKYAPGVRHLKVYPRSFLKQKTNTYYRPSLTTLNPLKKGKT